MGKYSLMKWFYNDQRIQFYMHDFMCIDTETIPQEDEIPKYFFKTTIEVKLQDQFQNIGLY